MFKYYIDAFKNIKDFSSKAKRKEFNYFILSWFIIGLIILVCFCCFVYIFDEVLTYLNITEKDVLNIFRNILFWFDLVNYVAFIPLTKRRINDLTQKYSNIIFILLILASLLVLTWKLWTKYIILPIMIAYSLPKIVLYIAISFALCCSVGVMITDLTLMIKK